MKRLNQQAFDRARQFFNTQARPLERSLFNYEFGSANEQDVLTELSTFQSADGGFGRALEPDVRTYSSSALATTIGLSILKDLHFSAVHPPVNKAIQFLLDTFDHQTYTWRIVPPDTNLFPHAPWWHDDDNSLAVSFDTFQVNPRAEIVGLLHHFSASVPPDWLDDLTERTVTYIESHDFDWIALICALKLAETEELPQHFKTRLLPRVLDVAARSVSRDPAQWKEYSPQPLLLAPSPKSASANLFWNLLLVNLDYQVDQQTPEGFWEPNWSWGGFYTTIWERARREWRGIVTLNMLTALRAFGRLEAI